MFDPAACLTPRVEGVILIRPNFHTSAHRRRHWRGRAVRREQPCPHPPRRFTRPSIWARRAAVTSPACSTARGSIWPKPIASATRPCRWPAICIGTCLSLWQQIGLGLRKTAEAYPGQIATIGVDTWGVDFGLLGRGDELLGNPYSYRDARTDGMLEAAFARVPRDEIFAATGVQFMQINTLYQLLAMRLANSPLLDEAESFLMMPDLFNWLLTGEKLNERTNATTTQSFDPRTADWAWDLLEQLEIPTDDVLPDRRARHQAGHAARRRWPPNGDWPRPKSSCPARTTRPAPSFRCRRRRAVGRPAELVLHQLGHLVADGRRDGPAGSRRPLPASSISRTKGASAARRGC